MAVSKNYSWLHRFAVLTAIATFLLLGAGGLVTSKGVGMAVPDWPTSYGYNMFALPFKFWKGGALYEHSHRLVASGVGLLTTILAVWLWFSESRRWLRWLGVAAFFAVVLQGVLGGLRVVWLKDQIGVFHATLAQLFFVLMCAIALFTSRWWKQLPSPETLLPLDGKGAKQTDSLSGLRSFVLATTLLILSQLVLGAAMRHQHAGLAIPDFPLAYGKLWPAMDADSVARYNQQRVEVVAANPITAFQIGLQMAHRFMALSILICVGTVAWRTRRIGSPVSETPLHRLAFIWLGLILVQVVLGAWTIWSNKAADVATAHVLVGALSLVTGALWCIISFRRPVTQFGFTSVPASARHLGETAFESRAAVAVSE